MRVRIFRTALMVVCLAAPAASWAQNPAGRDYLSQLSNVRASDGANDKTTISSDATLGDLRGLLTLTLDADGTGAWAFMATYLEDLRADGTPIEPNDHVNHAHDDPSTPALHREYATFRRDGSIVGTVTASALQRAANGTVVGIISAELLVANGDGRFEKVTGSGRVGPWASLPGALTLLLSF